jgi:hypothetical protein
MEGGNAAYSTKASAENFGGIKRVTVGAGHRRCGKANPKSVSANVEKSRTWPTKNLDRLTWLLMIEWLEPY